MTGTGYPRVQPRPLMNRLMAKTVPAPNGCLLWTGAASKGGYGVIGRGARGMGNVFVHVAVWEHTHGPVPDGYDVDHCCHNLDLTCPGGTGDVHRRCVRLTHLEAVTHQENVDRGRHAKGCGPSVRSTCPHGHPLDGIRHTRGGEFRQRFCRTCKNAGRRRARAAGKSWARSR